MSLSGKIVEVIESLAGSTLDGDHAAGAMVLLLADVLDFGDEGGRVRVGVDEAALEYVYLSVDEDASTVLLATGLLAAVESESPVVLLPEAPEKVASVVLDVDEGDVIEDVIVPHALDPLLVEGVRDPDAAESVVLGRDDDGDWLIADVVGRPAEIDSASLTGPAPDGWGSGPTVPPATAPVVSAAPFAIGTVRVTITPVDPALEATYEVAASLSSPVPEDGSATVGTTPGTTFDVATIGGVQIPLTAPIFVKVRAVNSLGVGPWSVEVSATARKADNEYISALFAYLGRIEANQVVAGTFEADLALVAMLSVGNRIEVSGTAGNTYIMIYATELDDQGNKIPLIELRPEGSTFRGRVVADDVSVMNGLILQGLMSQIAAGAGMTIMAGVADPTTVPSLSASLATSPWPKMPAGYKDRGMCWDKESGRWLRLLVSTASDVAGKCKVQRISTSGGDLGTVTLGNVPGISEDDMNGIVRIGAKYFVMVRRNTSNGNYWAPAKFNATTGAFLEFTTTYAAYGPTTSRPAITSNKGATGILMGAIVGGGLEVREWADVDWSTAGGAWETTHYWRDVDSNPGTWHLEWPAGGPADLSSMALTSNGATLTVAGGSIAKVYDVVSSVPYPNSYNCTLNPAKSFDLQSSGGGLDYRTTGAPGWYSEHAGTILYRYSDYLPAANESAYVTYANTVVGKTTLDSPPASMHVPVRRYLSIALGAGPPGVEGANVYLGLGTVLPVDANLAQRPEVLTAQRTMLIDLTAAGGAGRPPAANTFGVGGAGWFKSALGGFWVDGTGDGAWPKVEARIASAMAAGPRRDLNTYLKTGFTVYSAAYFFDIRSDGVWREIRGYISGSLPPGTTTIANAIPAADRPTQNAFGFAYLSGGNPGAAFVRSNGEIAITNMVTGTGTNGQFSIIYTVEE